MSQPNVVAPPVVSLQAYDPRDSAPGDPAEGHLASGLLVHPSMVLVPSPPAELLDRRGRFQVLIFPAHPIAGDPLIERIVPLGITMPFATAERPPLGATIRLSRPSRNPLSIRREPGRATVTTRALDLKLADGHDLWTALADLRAISPTMRRAPSKAVWNRLRTADSGPQARRPGHSTSGHDKTGHDKSGHDKSGQGTGGHGTGGHDKSGHGTGGHGTASVQGFGFNACWLFPWWCNDDD